MPASQLGVYWSYIGFVKSGASLSTRHIFHESYAVFCGPRYVPANPARGSLPNQSKNSFRAKL
jgi:hypothetical protein